MGERREQIEELSRHDPAFRRAMDCVRYGLMDYESAIEALVIAKHEQAEAHKEMLLDRMNREGPPPIIIQSGSGIATRIYTKPQIDDPKYQRQAACDETEGKP